MRVNPVHDADLAGAGAPRSAAAPGAARARRPSARKLRDPGREEPANEHRRERPVGREVERRACPLEALEGFTEGRQRRATERVVGATAGRGLEPGDHAAVDAEGRHPVADAFLGAGDDGEDGPAELLERRAPLVVERPQVSVDARGLAGGGTAAAGLPGRHARLSAPQLGQEHPASRPCAQAACRVDVAAGLCAASTASGPARRAAASSAATHSSRTGWMSISSNSPWPGRWTMTGRATGSPQAGSPIATPAKLCRRPSLGNFGACCVLAIAL